MWDKTVPSCKVLVPVFLTTAWCCDLEDQCVRKRVTLNVKKKKTNKQTNIALLTFNLLKSF